MGLFDFIFGKCVVSTQRKNAAKLLNVCMKSEIEYSNPFFEDNTFSITCHKKGYDKINSACFNRGIEITRTSYNGVPMLASKYKSRMGLAVGVVLSALLVAFALNVVWRVEISGNNRVSREEIESALLENNFCVGSFIPSADLTFIENSIMQEKNDIAWISINVNGTVAHVEIRETQRGQNANNSPAHLVASRDGKIERIESYNGNCVVKAGDVVRAGDVLVSGVYQNEKGDYRTSRAEGQIFARTVRTVSVEIPFENTQKVYTGRKFSEIYINFFKKSIKVFANTGKMPPTCDIIYKNGRIGLPSFPKIPIGYEKTEYSEYEFVKVVLNENEAMERAFSVLEDELEKLSESAELIKKNVEFEISDSAYVLKCSLVCIEDIAVTKEIE